MLQVTDTISIDEDLIRFRPLYASGPGGQNINKNMTAMQLRFDILNAHLPYEVQQRLINLAGSRVNKNLELVITARQHRSQEQNRKEAIERLLELIRKATEVPRPRLKRRRSRAENQQRLDAKRKQSGKKLLRKRVIL